jgi:type IV pilus assembly protein PilC
MSVASPPQPLTPLGAPLPAAPAPSAASVAASAAAKATQPWYKREFHVGRAVKPEIVMNFSRQLASFLRAGIPILEALAIVGDETSSDTMADVVAEMRSTLQRGGNVGDAVGAHPKVFPGYYIAMVRSAELTGHLDDVLDQLADYLDRDVAARRQVKSALTYPMFVMGLAVVAVVVMAVWVLPKFQELYGDLGAKLPLPTRVLLGFTDFMTAYWMLVVGGLGFLLLLGFALVGGKHGKARRDRVALKLPVLGTLFHLIAVERFCRVLAALADAGVPLPEAVTVSADSTNNTVFRTKLAAVREAMMRGAGLARPIMESEIFPAAARQMIRVGESTGSLDAQLASAARYYERELTYRLKKATDLFEPVVILVVGLAVGFVAVAQVSAMYSVYQQI